ncbi:Subtilisin-like proteinase Spm1 [Ceratocystis platani]|uniref:Subtilisin-like proteinase Spm1 n=1 Tax=Ceratocystis fimbriata f. sp. platani TaxID=88771 RepID=A0A0F8DL98_CERFI|nr:Subtilisin-like proteinase Spm1 [Ceratocystis platani]
MKGGLVFLLAASASAAPSSFSSETIHSDAAPILASVNAEAIPNSYIIKFKKHVDEKDASSHHSWVQSLHDEGEEKRLELRRRDLDVGILSGLKHTFNIGKDFRGYAGQFDDELVEQLRRHPDVEYIERDTIVHTMRTVPSTPEVEESCSPETEKNSPWGLARISHRDSLSFGTFNKYLYADNGGEGVDVYVIDTGCNTEHVDFEGRASWGKTIPAGDDDIDGNGHGTHCSGTIAGKKYGVAKKASIYAVKVLRSNGSGTMSDVVKGVEWAANAHIQAAKDTKAGKRKGFKGSAANMSLGGGKTVALDQVVNAAVDVGVHFAVAAGNDNADACNYSPAAAQKAVTVGASALDDSRAYFSNWGKCTDIFAPGLSIQSTWIGSKHAVNTISGTSMASPHIAGLLAYYLSLQPAADSEYSVLPLTPAELKANIINIATEDALSGLPKGTPNVLAWNGGGCSNYSSIIKQGGYKVKADPNSRLDLEELEDAINGELNVMSGKVLKGAESIISKAQKFSDRVHEIVDEEIREFVESLDALDNGLPD